MTTTQFADLGVDQDLVDVLTERGITAPFEIQALTIPDGLAGRDVCGRAKTGSGKTLAFGIPLVQLLPKARPGRPTGLALVPTRELAVQVARELEPLAAKRGIRTLAVYGGAPIEKQISALARGVEFVVATPGRMIDLIDRGELSVADVERVVIDEADRMLDMGFIPDIEFICSKLPEARQTLLFSATMPPPIEKLAQKFLTNPKRIEVSRAASTNENITAFKIPVKPREKRETLRWLLANDHVETAIIFANRKTTVREINKSLQSYGFASGEIHGDMDQSSRIAELNRFKAGEINILVASDVAARGLDVKGVSHVFNFDTPWHPDDYVHRIGRTGRAGAKGRAFTFVTSDDEEAFSNIEKLTKSKVKAFGKEDVRVELVDAKPKREGGRSSSDEGKREALEREDDREAQEKSKPSRSRKPRRDEQEADRSSQAKSSRGRGGRSRGDDNETIPAGEWNGPKPDFLSVSAL